MIRKLLATTALATLIAGVAHAQTATAPAPAAPAEIQQPADRAAPAVRADGFLASNIIGETVYNGTGDDAENIGEVNDLVIGSDGGVKAVVVGVGGFLGLGQKNVALDYGALKWAERDGDRWIVVDSTADALKALPDFDRSAYGPAPAVATHETVPTTDDTTAMAPAGQSTAGNSAGGMAAMDKPADGTAAANNETNAQASASEQPAATDTTKTGAIDRSTLDELNTADIRAEELIGTTVYGAGDENVGEIGDVILTQDGKVDAVIIDVGGFLGVGEKEVAVGMDNLTFLTDEDGNKYLYTTFTRQQLEAQAAYDKSTWAEKRDEQRMIVTR
ncbi:MAG TPA: PRC-barrel domain containing protein [Rhizobiales bacterium]|nr:PRC-barrel domain containing protein [Hyphomicrobiales bacterium]